MDPVSLTSLVLSLTTFCGKAVAGLNTLKDTWDDSSLSLTSLAAECATLGAALSVLEETLLKPSSLNSSDGVKRPLLGNKGSVTEALTSSIWCCFMTISELNDEIEQVQRHADTPGTLKARGKVAYIINEGRISQLAGLLRGQSGVLNTLQNVLQRQSLEEMERMMRLHNSQVRRVNSESEKSWRRRNKGARPPRSLVDVESVINADTATTTSTMFQKPFDFDDIAVNATAYRKVLSRAMRSQDNLLSRGSSTSKNEGGDPSNLFAAVKALDFDAVSLLLRDGHDPNQVDISGMTPLQRCASLVNPDAARIVSTLVHHGADIDAHRPGTGMTALRLAAKSGNLSIVKTLIGMGADPSVSDRLGAQAIHAAVQFNHADIVGYVLTSHDGDTGLEFKAAMWDDQEMTRDSSCTLLHFAAASNDADDEMVKLLLDYGLNPNLRSERGKTALQYAASRRKATVVSCLVQYRCDIVPEMCDEAREVALQNDWPEVMTSSLKADKITHSEIQELAERAVCRGRHRVADALLASLVTISNDSKETLGLQLMFAVEGGHVELSKYLLKQGASPWGLESQPSSPLSAACSFGYELLVKILLEHLIKDPRSRELTEDTPFIVDYLSEQLPLTLISRRGHKHLVPLLPWNILNRHRYLENGRPPLVIVAATTGQLEVAETLLKLGVDPNERTRWDPPAPLDGLYCGETALSFAVRRGLVDWVRFLLANNAQVDCRIRVPSESGRRGSFVIEDTPLTAVLRSRQPHKLELVKILLSYGADVNFVLQLPSSTIGDVARRHEFELIGDLPEPLNPHRREAHTRVALTPLMLACEDGAPALARAILADSRIDLSLTRNFGPLHVAVMSNNLVLVETLLADGRFGTGDIDLEQPSMDSFWPVCLASLGGFLEILEVLVDQHGADISSPFGDIDVTCPTLCLAAHSGQIETVKFLLRVGADLSWGDGTFLAARSNGALTAILVEEIWTRHARTGEAFPVSPISTETALSAPLRTPPTPPVTPNKASRLKRRLSDFFRVTSRQ
ncbi:hypothetical protein NM208_g1551 [Fusarium decemcellulare]|uniref:Uncharacterized protein n=1 Tax=Fusarium decemcellulare TaxID=57161 RepID=A0ACC1SVS9_9HYPO|nr:hypothetical protein NM208_g1551 [Fusarium decemcellulare]